jgi:DNA polymerase-1
MWCGLPFREIWTLDFEFIAEPGALPVPVCMVARELGSNRLIRLWHEDLTPEPPFPVDDQTLFVAFYMAAELGCFLSLGWPMPTRVLDLYAEFRNETNGIPLAAGRGLLGALSYHGIHSITKEEKQEERALIMRGGPWAAAERQRVLDYCQGDVDPLGALLERMLGRIRARPNGLGQALLRGRYTAAVACMERTGVPVDTDRLARIRGNWERSSSPRTLSGTWQSAIRCSSRSKSSGTRSVNCASRSSWSGPMGATASCFRPSAPGPGATHRATRSSFSGPPRGSAA